MTTAVWLPLAVVTAVAMESWARVLHHRVWHGALWKVHRSHHRKGNGLEANDVFAILHVPPSMALIILGSLLDNLVGSAMFGVGIGMTAFGVAYFVVHDGYVHGRLPVGFLDRIPAMRRVREAHAVHHKRNAAPFGLFLGHREIERAAAREG